MATRYEEPRAHAVRERYLAAFGGPELPVPVESIAEDLLGLRVEERWGIDVSSLRSSVETRAPATGASIRLFARLDRPNPR